MSLETKITVSLTALLSSALDLASADVPLRLREVIDLGSGTGAGRADKAFHDRRVLAASASESLDLAGGLTDAFGAAITFARVKAILVVAAAANVNNVVVGGAGSNAWATPFADATDKAVLRPGMQWLIAAGEEDATGLGVTAATGDLLQVANSGAGTPITYDIVLIGASV